MRYVTNMGYLFRLSELNYRQFLKARGSGEEVHTILDRLGKPLGVLSNVTDLSSRQAQELLDALTTENRER